MRKSSSPALDVDRSYFEALGATPRFDPERELVMARHVVRLRRAYWTVLLSRAHEGAVLAAIVAHGRDEQVIAHARTGALDELAAALDRAGDEHAASDAIVALAARCCEAWHRDAQRARAAYHAARNRFVGANLRLVVSFAQRYGRTAMALADRIQEGNLGLMKAVDRFDPERGVRFSTYAAWWIRHAIVRALAITASSVRIPTQIQQLAARADRARRLLWIELGREPELRELARVLDCDPERLTTALAATAARTTVRDDDDNDGIDALCDAGSLADLEDAVDRRDHDRMLAALAELPERERDIVHERFALPGAQLETFEQIGQRHGISRERARQVQRIALERLRRKLEPRPELRPWNAA